MKASNFIARIYPLIPAAGEQTAALTYRLVYQKAGLYGEKPQKAGIHNQLCNSLP